MNNYTESFEKAYAEIDDFNQKNCFPGGKPQAQRIVDSYRYLLQNDDLEESKIFELQKTIAVRIIMGFDNERIKITLNFFYSDIVPEDKQDPLLAFVRTSLTNPNVTLVAQEHEEDQTPVSDADSGKQVNYQFEGLSEFLAYVPISQAKGVSVVWVEGKDYRENFDKAYKLLDERRYLDAIPLYKRCLTVNPVAFRARLELMTCYTMTGQYSKAHEQVDALAQYKMPTSILAAFYR